MAETIPLFFPDGILYWGAPTPLCVSESRQNEAEQCRTKFGHAQRGASSRLKAGGSGTQQAKGFRSMERGKLGIAIYYGKTT